MKLKSVSLTNVQPVALFAVDNLSDVVVIAGPNGVGKTRLIQHMIAQLRNGGDPSSSYLIEATNKDEAAAWSKRELDLVDPTDAELFRQTLQKSRFRRNLTSSLVNFESDRTIQNIQPLAFSFDFIDPEDEEVGWDATFGFMRDRFQDTIHSMFRMIEAQKQGISTRALQLRREGKTSMSLEFPDPMEPFKEVFSLLLSPKELVDPSPRAQRLEFRVEDDVLPFTSLSSGEREVVNIAFDFLLRRPEDCIIFFDEPELHLHPELSYRLIQTLGRIGSRNQFIFSTHSPDIITASLDRSVIFLAPPKDDDAAGPVNQAIPVSEADQTNQALRLLGHSIGIVALGRRIVLIEGTEASIDKQTYGSIIGQQRAGLVLIPSGGKHEIQSFETVYREVLARSLWGVEFFMLCDGDSRPASSPVEVEATEAGRLRLLPRYHIENYFLDAVVWSKVFGAMEPAGSWLCDSAAIAQALREIALSTVSYATALAASHQIRQAVGNVDVMPKACHEKSLDELVSLVLARAAEEQVRADSALDAAQVESIVTAEYNRFSHLIEDDDPEWLRRVPGKPILQQFCNRAGIQRGRAKTLYLKEGLAEEESPFSEVRAIFDYFSVAT